MASFLTVGIFSTVLFTACNGDKCKDVVCNNGGTCSATDGSCMCAAGFEGGNCDTESRTKILGNYLLSGTDSDGGTYTNLVTTTTVSGASKTKFLINFGGSLIFTCTMSSASSFTIDNVTIATISYSGSGTYVGTTLSLSFTGVDVNGTVVTTLSGNKQ